MMVTAEPVLREENLLTTVKSYLDQVREELVRVQEETRDPVRVSLFRTESMDRLLISLYRLAEGIYRKNGGNNFRSALLAQGGYGRKELCLHSDIDLLFLYEGKAEGFIKLLTGKVLQNLWDAGLEVGFATRTVKDCRRLMEEDLTIMTSLIDARYLAGEREVADKFQEMFSHYFSSAKNKERFLRKKEEENEERKEKYGGSVYLLEPNLKEGEGGLRDYHSLYWFARIQEGIAGPEDLVGRGYLTQEEFRSLWEALKFLWTIRNELHRRSGRRFDQLTFDYQEPVAQGLDFRNTAQFLGVELFMQKYYAQAATIQRLTDKAVRRLKRREPALFPPPKVSLEDRRLQEVEGRLTIVSPDLFEREPLYLLKIFDIARRFGLEIDDFTKESAEKNAFRIDEQFCRNPEAAALFRAMLKETAGLGAMLTRMNETGVLRAFLPEFAKLHFRVQHDLYHVYTVDVHSIFAVGELEKLARGDYATSHPTLSHVIRDIEAKDLLAFAILYHDIGKGEGRGHVEKGAPIIRRAGERLGFASAEVDILEFLERSHLIMTHVAFRRDLEDQNLIIQFARAMGSLELLNLLYVLTFCDVKGVSPEAMTDWKASLLEYLYLKTREVIQKGAFTKERASSLIPKVLQEVVHLFHSEADREKCREFFSMMPPRYLLATPPSQIVRHVRLWEKFEPEHIVIEARALEKEGLNEVILLTWENPALFSRMAGLFAAHNINILEAQLNLSTKGHALQIFKVTDAEGKVIDDSDRWQRIEKDLREVLEGRIPIETLVAEKFRPSLFKKKVAQIRPTRVDIDNDLSAYYTVIDVFTHDRTGLLYQITSTLSALGLYVDVSKISTKVDQVADTFYVKDIFGHKITSEERLKKIREVLMKVIEEEPTPGWRPPTFA
jgi:[protein-PII] uridylyltransferase